jgi:hypothetical protein
MRTLNLLFFSIFLLIPSLFVTPSQQHQVIGAHEARFNSHGQLLPWVAWNSALDREMKFYAQCPWSTATRDL